jgi:predicted ATPase
MLTQLHIKNFKAWKDTRPVRLAPLTVLFGTNSSGKSSFGQFLLMLKQTVESPDRKSVFNTGDANSAVNLGSYSEMVHKRDPQSKIAFSYEWQLAEPLSITDPRSSQEFSGNQIAFNAEVGPAPSGQPGLTVHSLEYHLKNANKETLRVGMHPIPSKIPSRKGKYEISAKPYKLTREQMKVWQPGAPVRFYGFPGEVTAYYQNADFVQDFNLATERLFKSIYYLGPLREKAARLYHWSGGEPESVGFSGQNTVSALLSARERQINDGYKKKRKRFEELIASKLKEMGLIDSFKVNQISEKRREYEVKVKVPGAPDFVDLPDVGFGISQVLPVLVECFYAPANSIIIMEQPEIHLHPKAQTCLADLFIDVICAREDGHDRNIQLIVETHSEHFLRRLQRRIAEQAIENKKVAAYFAHLTNAEFRLDELEIDIFGNILNWPENFFGDEVGDLVAMTEAAANRQAKEKGE